MSQAERSIFAQGMGKSVVEVTRHHVPFRAQMFGVATAEVLRRADILWRFEFGKEVDRLPAGRTGPCRRPWSH